MAVQTLVPPNEVSVYIDANTTVTVYLRPSDENLVTINRQGGRRTESIKRKF